MKHFYFRNLFLIMLLFIPSRISCFTNILNHNPKSCLVSVDKKKPFSRVTNIMFTSKSFEFDTSALAKYTTSIGVEMAAIATTLGLIDIVSNKIIPVPTWLVFLVFYSLSLKSRIFSPLDNRRPDLKNAVSSGGATRGFGDRIMPKWTPPGVFFPIMWLLIISPLRAYSSLIIYQINGGHFLDTSILALMFHLSVGDTWNTINNIEKRLGASVPGVLFVLISAVFASYKYYEVNVMAGKLLACTCIWLTIASILIIDTWRLNPNKSTGKKFPFYPVKSDDVKTRFFYES